MSFLDGILFVIIILMAIKGSVIENDTVFDRDYTSTLRGGQCLV